jgi:enoyl-CoA hydratase
LTLAFEDNIAVVTLDRPPANALTLEIVEGLERSLDEIDAAQQVRVVLFRSANSDMFCAGADIAFIQSSITNGAEGRSAMLAFVRRLQSVLSRIENHPLPSVAVVSGACTGAGLELALSCDIRVVADTARLGLPEARIGLVPGAGGTQRLTAIAGRAMAARLILEAELIDGVEALRVGIASHCVPAGDVQEVGKQVAASIARRPMRALSYAKACMAVAPSSRGFELELTATAELLETEDTAGLIKAFLSRRQQNMAGGS